MPGPAPRSAVFVRPDTLGDLVLFAPTLRCLREAWPDTRLGVVIRRHYLGLARLLVPRIDWLGTDCNVFVQGPGEAREDLTRLGGEVAAADPDLMVGACSHRNWLETALAARVPRARRVVLGPGGDDPYFGAELRRLLAGAAEGAPVEEAPFAARDQDWERNYGLAEHLLGRTVEHRPPQLELPAAEAAAADRIVRGLGLEPAKFAACAAAGFAHVRLKTWPAESYATVLRQAWREHGLPALLVGTEDERAHLDAVQRAAGEEAAKIWTGGPDDLALLAGILSQARLYFGNDTGAMHLAAALGKPLVAIFGGGTWPRFQPAARAAIVLVHPLPCFGCGWDCAFGDAPCVKAVGVDPVQQALTDILRGGAEPRYEVRTLRALPEPTVDLMGRAAALYRQRAFEHHARQAKLDELTAESEKLRVENDNLHAERERLQAACDERLELITRLDGDLHRLLREANAREHVIADLNRQLNR